MIFRRLIVLLALFFSPPLAAEGASPIGKPVDDFRLTTHLGNKISLSNIDSEIVVLVFLGTECPLVKRYAHRLSEIQQKYAASGVTLLGINSNAQDSLSEIKNYADEHKISFPILKDLSNTIADRLNAQRTPEVFVLDADRKIQYHGRIDDQYLVGLTRTQADREDLRIALDELLAGKPVSVPETKAVGCHIGRSTRTTTSSEITYHKDIAPILNARCVECHRDQQVAPFPLAKYQDLVGWEETIAEVIQEGRMPPWFADPAHGEFINDARLTDRERELILTWIDNGSPEGKAVDATPAPSFPDGWRIPEPHEVVYMNQKGFEVRAEGVVDYQYLVVDPKWDEDKYIGAAEARPGNPEVVHHIIVYVMPPNARTFNFDLKQLLIGYAPGSRPTRLEPGTAIRVPAGSKLLFELHYNTNGVKQTDRSYVGFRYVEKETVKTLAATGLAINTRISIPRRDPNHREIAEYVFPEDQTLLKMTPHMHLRGKSFRYEAFFPDGTTEILLNVPRYDFNWQLDYELREPRFMPKGTKIRCIAHYDNSPENLANPDPEATVRWGRQSHQEMLIGWFGVLSPYSSD